MSSIVLDTSTPSRRVGRSVAAIFAGLFTILVTHHATDALLHATRVFPGAGVRMSDELFALAFGYRAVFSVLGGYVTARVAPHHPVRHALWLGGIGLVICTAALLATWNRPELGPGWYTLALAVSSIPCAFIGAKAWRR